MSRMLTEADLAERLSVPEHLVAKWRRVHRWPHVKVGRQVRFTEADVHAIESLHHVASAASTTLPDQTSRSAARGS